jgi:4,5-DOPA dioxygenase extradiol
MIAPLFVSHGAPTLLGEDVPARDFLAQLGGPTGRPSAVLAVSAHWETATPAASTAVRPETIHDFYGFPRELYAHQYPAPGAPALAERAVGLLREAGIVAAIDRQRGLDHGAWVPLKLMYPKADIPVTQLSIQPELGPAHHLNVGRALAPLTNDDVLVLASGSATHNLRTLAWGRDGQPAPWAKAFDDWLAERVAAGDAMALVDYRRQAPSAAAAHPSDEHFLPLFVALGAAGNDARGERIHASFTHGSLSMAAFRFS